MVNGKTLTLRPAGHDPCGDRTATSPARGRLWAREAGPTSGESGDDGGTTATAVLIRCSARDLARQMRTFPPWTRWTPDTGGCGT